MGFFYKDSNHDVNKCSFLIQGLLLAGCLLLASCAPAPSPTPTPDPTATTIPPDSGPIQVSVFDRNDNPLLKGVVVRVPGTNQVDGDDHDVLRLDSCNDGQYITAWAVGYYIASIGCRTNATEYNIKLTPFNVSNNTVLSWISAGGIENPLPSCSTCHSNSAGMNEYPEWLRDGHSNVFHEPYFWTMYLGSDINGIRGEITRWSLDNQGNQARALSSTIPYSNTGFKLDFPSESGNCAYCHAPASAIGSQVRMDISQTIVEARSGRTNSYTEGINCDICHKVVGIQLGSDKKPFPDKPGVLSYEFIHEDRFLFMGPRADAMNIAVPNLNVSCAPIFSESGFCAPCHTAKFNGTQIYDSYGEWLSSSYSDPKKGSYKTCQACHMLPAGITDIAEAPQTTSRQACSQYNETYSDLNHNMLLRGDDNIPALIKQAAEVKLKPEVKDGKINLTVTVTNINAGHKFPTDSPLRHLILVIEATTSSGAQLPMIEGERIPLWGGVGNSQLDYAGKPGKIYANILMSKDTFFAPSIDYWNAVQPAWKDSDTRLPPLSPVDSKYVFALPPNGEANFHVKLIYRYAFIDLARQKGWPVNDIIAFEAEARVP